MPSTIENAVGTQRQFTKQPVATYQSNLINPGTHAGMRNADAGQQLARALGVLGDSIMNYAVAHETQKEVDANKVLDFIHKVKGDEWKATTAVELMNEYGHFELADNPYAVALIEKSRGNYFREKGEQEYALEVAKNGRAKTAEEEEQRYNAFMQKYFDDNVGVSLSEHNFRSGFYNENYSNSVLNQINQKISQDSSDLKSVRNGSLKADWGTICSNARALGYKTGEDATTYMDGLVGSINKFTQSMPWEGMSYTEKHEFFTDALQQIAEDGGSRDLLTKIGDLTFTTLPDGTEVKFNQAFDFNTLNKISENGFNKNRAIKWRQLHESMLKCNSPEALDTWERGLTQQEKEQLGGAIGSYRIQLQEQKKIQAERAVQSSAKNAKFENDYNTAMIGLNNVLNGKVPNVPNTSVAVNREVATKKIDEIWNNGGLSMEQKADMIERIESSKYGKEIREDARSQMQMAFDSMGPNGPEGDDSVYGVTAAIERFRANPNVFKTTYGKDLYELTSGMVALLDISGDSKTAYNQFYNAKANLRDNWKEINDTYNSYVAGQDIKIDNMDVNESQSNFTLDDTTVIGSKFKNAGIILLAANPTNSKSVADNLSKSINKYYVGYSNENNDGNAILIPKAFFGDVASDNVYDTSDGFMNRCISDIKNKTPGSYPMWSYDEDTQKLRLIDRISGQPYFVFSKPEFTEACNARMYNPEENIEKPKYVPHFKTNEDVEDAVSEIIEDTETTD